jgi:hypothetical protein
VHLDSVVTARVDENIVAEHLIENTGKYQLVRERGQKEES